MNTNVRRKDREVTDKKEIEAIVAKAKILHLGLFDGDYPYIVPLHYGFEYKAASDSYVFYMHGAKVGHKLDLIKNNPNACIELETDVELSSGGEVACEYGSFYSSFIGRGKASIVEDNEEKRHGLNLLMFNQTGRKFDFPEPMLNAVAVMKVEVSCYTAKARKKI